jgi:hypothetical protein
VGPDTAEIRLALHFVNIELKGNGRSQSTDPVQTQQRKRVPDCFDTRTKAKFRGVGYQKEVSREGRIREENVLDSRHGHFVVGGEVQQIQGGGLKVGQLGQAAGGGGVLRHKFYLADGVSEMRKWQQR